MVISKPKDVKNKILLFLRTPPPYGGGEIRAAALRDFILHDKRFFIHEIQSNRRQKSNQGNFSFWKLVEFIDIWFHSICYFYRKPSVFFLSLPKSFLHFFRDSLLIWTALLFSVPVTGELAGATFYFLGKGRLQTWYGRIVIKRLACLRVLGQSIAKDLKHYGIVNTIICDNGVDCETEYYATKNMRCNILKLLFVGTHSHQKGFDLLVDAAAELKKRKLNFHVHCLGEWSSGSFRQNIHAKLKKEELLQTFYFHGHKQNDDKWSIFKNSDILVLPSLREGQPLVILESFFFGIPVIATSVGAVPDTVEDGRTGYLISPGNKQELCEAIESLLTNSDLRKRMSKHCRATYNARFTQKAYLDRQVALLISCAQGQIYPQGQIFTPPDSALFSDDPYTSVRKYE